jgi:hypothetical protein
MRTLGIVLAVFLALFIAALGWVLQLGLPACFSEDPTPAVCDEYGLTGKSRASRMGRIIREEMATVLADEKVRALGRGDRARAQALGRALGSKGIVRLEDSDLDTWNGLRVAFAENSERACAGLAAGALDEASLYEAMDSLPEPDARAWMRVAGKAMLAEVHQKNPYTPDEQAIEEGLAVIVKALKEDDQAKFFELAEKVDSKRADPKEQCELFKTLARGAQGMEPKLRRRFLRETARAQ